MPLRPLRPGLPKGAAAVDTDADLGEVLDLRWPAGGLRARDLTVVIQARHVLVQVRGQRPAYCQRWNSTRFDVVPDESTWQLVDSILSVRLDVRSNTGGVAPEVAMLFESACLKFMGVGA